MIHFDVFSALPNRVASECFSPFALESKPLSCKWCINREKKYWYSKIQTISYLRHWRNSRPMDRARKVMLLNLTLEKMVFVVKRRVVRFFSSFLYQRLNESLSNEALWMEHQQEKSFVSCWFQTHWDLSTCLLEYSHYSTLLIFWNCVFGSREEMKKRIMTSHRLLKAKRIVIYNLVLELQNVTNYCLEERLVGLLLIAIVSTLNFLLLSNPLFLLHKRR